MGKEVIKIEIPIEKSIDEIKENILDNATKETLSNMVWTTKEEQDKFVNDLAKSTQNDTTISNAIGHLLENVAGYKKYVDKLSWQTFWIKLANYKFDAPTKSKIVVRNSLGNYRSYSFSLKLLQVFSLLVNKKEKDFELGVLKNTDKEWDKILHSLKDDKIISFTHSNDTYKNLYMKNYGTIFYIDGISEMLEIHSINLDGWYEYGYLQVFITCYNADRKRFSISESITLNVGLVEYLSKYITEAVAHTKKVNDIKAKAFKEPSIEERIKKHKEEIMLLEKELKKSKKGN